MINFFRLRARSFRYAFAGWVFVIRTQKNAWIYAIASAAVLLMAFLLWLPARDWANLNPDDSDGVDRRIPQYRPGSGG